ncbi:MAG: acyltransferase [Clostridia bacterium]|nr:acyltransferase [Clostridia bacterium]
MYFKRDFRNFDVPLLVILSGFLAVNSHKSNESMYTYLKKRFIRLVLPVWIFLTIFFFGALIVRAFGIKYPFSLNTIFRSYALIDGIGYVWIIRVYLLCALSVPLLIKIKEKLNLNIYYVLIILVYILYEILYYSIGEKNYILKYLIYYFIPYGILTFIGMEIKEWKSKRLINISVAMFIIFVILMLVMRITTGRFIQTNELKYPPTLYYLSYSIGMSLLMYYLVVVKNVFNIKNKINIKIITFISSHTMWIYLWHILYLYIIDFKFKSSNWLIKFIVITILSMLTACIQSKIIKRSKIKNKIAISILDC